MEPRSRVPPIPAAGSRGRGTGHQAPRGTAQRDLADARCGSRPGDQDAGGRSRRPAGRRPVHTPDGYSAPGRRQRGREAGQQGRRWIVTRTSVPSMFSPTGIAGRMYRAIRRVRPGQDGWGGWGSNPRPADYENAAFPRWLPHQRLCRSTRVSAPPVRPFRRIPIATLIGSRSDDGSTGATGRLTASTPIRRIQSLIVTKPRWRTPTLLTVARSSG